MEKRENRKGEEEGGRKGGKGNSERKLEIESMEGEKSRVKWKGKNLAEKKRKKGDTHTYRAKNKIKR